MPILQSFARGLRLPGQQPRGPMRIDWSHPISRGLSYVRLLEQDGFGRPLYIDNGDDGAVATNCPGSQFGIGKEGVGLTGIGSILTGPSGTKTYLFPSASASTFVARAAANWSPTDGSNHILYAADDQNGNFFYCMKFSDDNWYVGWYTGVEYRVSVAATGTFNAGDTFSVAHTSNASGSKLFTKGIQRGTKTPATVTPVVGGSQKIGGSANTTGDTWNRQAGDAIYYVAIWSRVLSDDEIRLLDAEPYCFFTSAEAEMPALLVTGATAAVRRTLTLTGVS